MDTIYFDWSQHRGVCARRKSTDEVTVYLTLADMLPDLPEPTRLVGEATFESFRLEKRYDFISACEAAGHVLLTTPTRLTGRWRRKLGFSLAGETKTQSKATDVEDTRCFEAMDEAGIHLKRASRKPDADYLAKRERLHDFMVRTRADGEIGYGPRGGVKYTPAKEGLAEKIRAGLPAYELQSPEIQKALGDGYSTTILFAVWAASQFADNRQEFDRLMGAYAHGYGTQLRSDFYHWTWGGGAGARKLNDDGTRKDGLRLSELRFATRWLYHQVKNMDISGSGINEPAKGNYDPIRLDAGARALPNPQRAIAIPAPASVIPLRVTIPKVAA